MNFNLTSSFIELAFTCVLEPSSKGHKWIDKENYIILGKHADENKGWVCTRE